MARTLAAAGAVIALLACPASAMALDRELTLACGRGREIPGLPIAGGAAVMTRAGLETSASPQERDEKVGLVFLSGKASSLVWGSSFVVEVGDPVPVGPSVYRVGELVRDERTRKMLREEEEERGPEGRHACDVIHLRVEEHPHVQLSAGSVVLSTGGMHLSREGAYDPELPLPSTFLMAAVFMGAVHVSASGEVVADVSWQKGPLNFWRTEQGRKRPNPGCPSIGSPSGRAR